MEDFSNSSYEYEDAAQEVRLCDSPGCMEQGECKAPKSRDQEKEYYWFCVEHAREYNKQWDYFDGMGREEIESFMREAETGHRPTWKTSDRTTSYTTDDLCSATYRIFKDDLDSGSGKSIDIDPKLHKALAVLDMNFPVTIEEIKQQYKKLVKKHHPDATSSNKNSEEIFKRITQAYHEAMKLMHKEESTN